MDFPRSYLDESVWNNQWNRANPMADFPGVGEDGPAAHSLVIDFTHGIERRPESANQDRWRTRLETIERRWGAGGADELWCAPTAEVAAYVQAAKAAKVTLVSGKVTVSIPDDLPGSPLTLRLSGVNSKEKLRSPEGGILHTQGTDLILTTPLIGLAGAAAPVPQFKCIYKGPAVSVDFSQSMAVAGITLRVFGNPSSAIPYRVALRTAKGEVEIARRNIGPGWTVGTHLCPIVPNSKPILASGVSVSPAEALKEMTVWGMEGSKTSQGYGATGLRTAAVMLVRGIAH